MSGEKRIVENPSKYKPCDIALINENRLQAGDIGYSDASLSELSDSIYQALLEPPISPMTNMLQKYIRSLKCHITIITLMLRKVFLMRFLDVLLQVSVLDRLFANLAQCINVFSTTSGVHAVQVDLVRVSVSQFDSGARGQCFHDQRVGARFADLHEVGRI